LNGCRAPGVMFCIPQSEESNFSRPTKLEKVLVALLMLERKQIQIEPATLRVVSLMFWSPDPNEYVKTVSNPLNVLNVLHCKLIVSSEVSSFNKEKRERCVVLWPS